jgi:carboxypeptidase T
MGIYMKKFFVSIALITAVFGLTSMQPAMSNNQEYYWIKIAAKDKFQRSMVANTGAAIEIVKDDFVIAYGNDVELKKLQKLGWVQAYSNLALEDFPPKDAAYHNYSELTEELNKLAAANRDLVSMQSIAKTNEGRDLWSIRISGNLNTASIKPGVIFMGGHHAREHLSIEMPLMLAQYLVEQYRTGNSRIVNLINNRDIHIIPIVNPDGAEYDIKDGSYKMWRKNRTRNSDGTFGVDLNRNYGYQWGTGGSSSSPSSDTYKGTKPFSEIESNAIKNYIEANENINILLSFHSFSKLILYPWGHKYAAIETANDKRVHELMAQKMSEWNGYTPQQSSELYIASGDTTDWSYGVHKIISFTFELDPANNGFGGGGFYPGAGVIQPVFQKNIEPALYLIEYSDNPYRVLNVGIRPINPNPTP